MVIKVPQHLQLSESLKKEIFMETGYPLPEWEISVQRHDDIAWSIVLSYLISTNYRRKDDFSKRLKALTDSNSDKKFVNKSIRRFNPFRNRFSCFFDKYLKRVVNDFKAKLNWDSLISVPKKLSAASRSLNCPILLIPDDPEVDKHKTFMENAKTREGVITLKSSTSFINDRNECSKVTVYNFMINESLGSKLKIASLLYFLNEVKMSRKEIIIVMESVRKGDSHLLISLLKRGCYDIILKLYKSPYIVSKISEAGYEMDPRLKDSDGLSAMYHALSNTEITTMLYYFAVNNCFLSEGSYRNPDSSIVSNLLHMEEILSTDFTKLKNLSYDETFSDLMKFNKFLIAVNGRIVKIKSEINYYESREEDVFQARKKRDIILTLLDTYKDFFYVIQGENPTSSPLDDYMLHSNYYNLIDTATAVIFFDNIVYLKETLTLKCEENKSLENTEETAKFSEIESSFCFSAIYLLIFRYAETVISNILDPRILFSFAKLYVFPLLQRLHNFEKTEKFSSELRNTVISKDNIVKCIPKSEIYSTLHQYPELKDAIEQKRLQYYIKTVLNVKITNESTEETIVQSFLVIERTLQVIGEYLTQDQDIETNKTYLRRFLRLCLPEDASRMLLQLRNELTHLKGHAFPSKFECEKNLSLFRCIRREILEIEKKFRIVYRILNLNLYTYFAKQLEKELERVKNSTYLYANTIIQPLSNENFTEEMNNIFNYIFKRYEHSYLGFLEIVLQRSEEKIENEMSRLKSHNFVDVINKIRYILSPLKWLLELVQRCNVYSVETLLNILKSVENCQEDNVTINDFQEKTNAFLEHCNDLLSTHTIKKRKKTKPLKNLKNIEYFLKILKGFVFLSKKEQDNIRKEIPSAVRESVLMKEKLIQSVKDDFSYDIDETPDFEIVYLSKNKMKDFKMFYRSKDSYALTILQTPDPIEELEEIFSTNTIGKKKYDFLCKVMQFSDETSSKLGKLVAGQRKKHPGNNLKNLHNRIQLLKKLIIEENEDVWHPWIKIKSRKSRQLIFDRIVQNYLKDHQLEAAVDMLLFDCMILFETAGNVKSSWVKSSKLYSGINLRNVISHGNPLLEFLCAFLDPEDLPSEKIRNILRLIEDEDSVKAILTLSELLENDFGMLLKIIHSEEKDEYCDLRGRILQCSEWEDYVKLLPYYLKAFDKS